MITYLQAVVLGALQGITELFPVSSLGHSIIIPGLLGWHVDIEAQTMLEFLVATHFATALVLFFFYSKDWMRIIGGVIRSLGNWKLVSADPAQGGSTYARLGWLLIAGTIPAGIVGFALQKKLEALFINPRSAAIALIGNGVLLFVAEIMRRRAVRIASAGRTPEAIAAQLKLQETVEGGDARIAKLTFPQAVKVGVAQILALIPGISRTGSTFAGSLATGLSHEDSLRFSFLLATPIIGGAALLELPKLIHAGGAIVAVSLAGAVAAAVCAFVSAKILVRYFKTNTLFPFAIYCAAAGAIALIFIR